MVVIDDPFPAHIGQFSGPVSYTHLDVYKRQGLYSAMTPIVCIDQPRFRKNLKFGEKTVVLFIKMG